MKYLLILLMVIPTVMVGAQEINLGKDQCAHCSMIIRDQQFAALAIDNQDKAFRFDAVECLVNFLKTKDEADFKQLLVTDFPNPGQWIAADKAVYLKSQQIPSPMGAYLSAYTDEALARNVSRKNKGKIFSWEELKIRFEKSQFGQVNHPDHHHGSGTYAPIGIMGAHVHHKGGFMMSFRTMQMNMKGNVSGSINISDQQIFTQYMMSPKGMRMTMYMLGLMYAPTDKLTLMLMQPYRVSQMDMETKKGMQFETRSQGPGDTKVLLLYNLLANHVASFHLNGGLSIPSGNINQTADTPMSDDARLPYTMQMGSGTFDYTLGGTFRFASGKYAFGLQQLNVLRTGTNSAGYRLGNQYQLNAWTNYQLNQWLSVTGRVNGTQQGSISGSDELLNKMMSPTANAANSGSAIFLGGLGLSICPPTIGNLRLGVEWLHPLYQSVSGIQMKATQSFNLGLQYML